MKKILLVLLFSISSIAHAQWSLIDTSDDAAFFIDYSTLQQAGQYKRVWRKTEYFPNSEMTVKHNVRSVRRYVEHDCREKKTRNLSFSAFKQSNLVELIQNDNKTDEWNFIAPDTYSMFILEAVCKRK